MQAGYYRFPTIYQDTVIFVCEDDLWRVACEGGLATRLTANLGRISSPALSPDGTQVAFTGRDEGEAEVYAMPTLGGPMTRLTFLGANTEVVGWTPDGQAIVFRTDFGQPFSDLDYLYTVPLTGGQPQQLPTGPALSLSFGPQGGLVIGRNTTDVARWKRYRGGQTGDLWLDRDGQGAWRRLLQLAGNTAKPCWVGERIYFVSDHEGVGNLYSCLPNVESPDLRRHTDHDDFYVRHPATDGQRIVYHAGADLYLFDPSTDAARQIEVDFRSPQVQRNRRFVYAAHYLESFAPHPKGHTVAVITRGKPFSMANWEQAVVQHGELNGVRYRLINWLYEGNHLVMISDALGEETLEIHRADGTLSPYRFEGLDIGRPLELVTSPNKNQLVLTNHRNELLLLDLETAEPTPQQLDRSRHHVISDVTWSADGAWLAYSFYQTRRIACIKLCHVPTGETHVVTRPVLRDVCPSFDPEGKYLYFLSYRDFDAVYDSTQFALTFPLGMRPYLITLQADLPSPFIPKPAAPGGDKKEEDDNDNDDEDKSALRADNQAKPTTRYNDETGNQADESAHDDSDDENENDGNGNDKSDPKAWRIDLDGITERVIPFPVSDGRYGRIWGLRGKVLFTAYPVEFASRRNDDDHSGGRGELEVFDFEERDTDSLVYDVDDFTVSLDGKTLLYRSGHRLRLLKAGSKPDSYSDRPSRKSGWLDLHRIRPSVLPQAEWEQMYREAWRLQRDFFWTETMSDVDWQVVYDRYLPLIQRVATRSEFSDLMWEMQGELGTSHAYEVGGDYRQPPFYAQGYLGADIRFDAESEAYIIDHIVRGDVWDEQATSPLSQPGLPVNEGDRIVAVNGRAVSRELSPQALLVNQTHNEVFLTIVRQDDSEMTNPQTVSVKTLYNERPARYRAWVEGNRRQVHEATAGRVGYIHIPDMTAEGYTEFHRSYLAEVGREGLIVDVRFNAGGNVSQLIMEKLSRRRLGYDVQRWGEPLPYPADSPMGPLVALCNEYTYSDGDVFAHAFKLLKLGPLIGKRTWGGVVGYAVNEVFVDGGHTTQPEFSFWFTDVGWAVENFGTTPDIEVEMRPQDYLAGQDVQLERSISEILKTLTDNPPTMPTFDNRPSLRLPKLPKLGGSET